MLAFWPQSSDALDYLDIGKQCAETGMCFDNLRSVITCYWFSLPYRLGVSPDSFMLLAHIVLLLVSVALASRVILVLMPASAPHKSVSVAGVIAMTALVHGVFLLPTFFHALTDTPAALVVLIALELFLLVHINPMRQPNRVIAVVGLLLGIAVALRVFNLYPLLITVLVYQIVSWRVKEKGTVNAFKKRYLWLMLLPIGFQVAATYQHKQEVSYLPTEGTQFWRNIHQYSAYIGYDTLLPEESYPWFGDKATCMGLRPALEQQNWRGLLCTLGGRIHFLLGSYSHQTYIQTDRIEWDYLSVDPGLHVETLQEADWPYDMTQGGGRVTPPQNGIETPQRIVQEIWLDNAGPVTVNLTARDAGSAIASSPVYLHMRIESVEGKLFAGHWLELGKQLQRHHWHLTLDQPGRYVVAMEVPTERPAPAVFDAGDFTVQAGVHEEPYPIATERIRFWSMGWLVVQCVSMIALLALLLSNLRCHARIVVLAILPLLTLAQSLLIIPEQRFVVVFEIMLWLGVVASLRHRWQKIATIGG